EPDFGSDPGGMRTVARRSGSDYVLNGTKAWITNGGIADVAIVWARTDPDDGPRSGTVRGFVVPTTTKGFSTRNIERKLSLRASVTSELTLEGVRVPNGSMLPEVSGLRGPLSCLTEARFGIAWGTMGAARACFEAARDYSMQRRAFGKPIASFQLTQEKLVDMATALLHGRLVAHRLGVLKDSRGVTPEQVSIAKRSNVRIAIDIARTARTVLGANGITLEYPVVRHMNNLESVLTYEGTEEVHTLVIGKAITGEDAFS
ncbi:MAG: acyl-CoA dehydrogenase family protein, partial [Candidatus Dormibacteraeota bacterium]|nr:acyl-CoA dehydrogenase family protein [Candidatus Dormibacteraeota bacterium]